MELIKLFGFQLKYGENLRDKVSKVFILEKEIESLRLDPFLETADTDLNNNSWPAKQQPTRFELFKQKSTGENPMQRQKRLEQLNKN